MFSPLGQGMLTDKYLDGIPEGSRAAKGRFLKRDFLTEENLARVRALNEIAQRRGQSLAQMALAWVLRDPRVTSALIGASSVAQLEDNVGRARQPRVLRRGARRDRPHAVDAGINIWAAVERRLMPKGHALFTVTNHTANRVVKLILSSPAHGMLSDRLLILTVTGRRTGKQRTFPVAYQQTGDKLTLHIDWPEKKVWWRNLIGGAPVAVRLRNVVRHGRGVTVGDVQSGVHVDIDLDG